MSELGSLSFSLMDQWRNSKCISPVAKAVSEAFYYPLNLATDSIDSQVGHMIYEEFNTVVILWEQLHVTDKVWHDFLQHLRYGHVQPHHINMLWTLLIHNLKPHPLTSTPPLGTMSHLLHLTTQYGSSGMSPPFGSIATIQAGSFLSAPQTIRFKIGH